MPIVALDHVQLAMPPGREAEARAFYQGLLGLPEVPKPPNLATRGGCWFERGDVKVHLGVEQEFRPARKAHPALRVHDLGSVRAALEAGGVAVRHDEPLEGYERFYVDDPFGNRIELLEPIVSSPQQPQSLTREQALTLVQRLMDTAQRRDVAQLVECYAEHAVAVSPVFGEVRGRAAIADTWQRLFATFADFAVEITDILVDGHRIAVLSAIETMDRLGWFGLRATGSPISYRLVLLFTIENGKIVRDERIYDSAGILERLEKARLDKELRTAAEVQRALLARTTYRAAFCESIGDSVPCRAIGGDFFEFIELPAGGVGLAMGDVAGKGPAAALLASLLQGMFAVEASTGDGPAATLNRINQRLAARRLESRFATVVYAVLSPDGRLTYANAGHNPPALLTREGIRRLDVGGPILGAFANVTYEQETLTLRDGDMLTMFTDGVTEARNAGDEEFGEHRLLACLNAAPAQPAALLNHIFGAVRGFCGDAEQTDDITVAVTSFAAH
jgi:ketosteroid isomerase-like protein